MLLDLYDLDAIQAYPVEDGAEYPIRIYTVTMAHDEDQGHLVVTNIGHLFESRPTKALPESRKDFIRTRSEP